MPPPCPSSRSERRIPSLDGLRAVSIAMVVASHAGGTRHAPFSLPTGELGVRVFFLISGYLITSLLVDELDRTGSISLRRFYLRRTFRIFPAYYAYLAAIAIASIAGAVTLQPGDAIHALTYTTNYHPHRSWWIGHTWSLGVEEQFYVMWPALLLMLGTRRGLAVAATFVLAGPLLRLADWYAMPGWHAMQGESFWTIGDSVALGCVLALVRPHLATSTTWLAFQRGPYFALVPIAGVAAYLLGERYTLPSLVVLQTVTIACIAACLDWVVRFPRHAVGRVLNSRPLVFVGGLSYSLYVWQQPFLDRHSHGLQAVFPFDVALAFTAALASYYLIEQPMLRLRERIETRAKRRPEFVLPVRPVAAARRPEPS